MSEMIPLSADDDFSWTETRFGPTLVCRPLEAFARHVFTTRSWRLGAAPATDAHGWNEVAAAIDIAPHRLLRMRQVHGNAVVIHHAGQTVPAVADADIILSNDTSVALAVQIADCIPLLVADSRTGSVAASHAGWRGLIAGVPAVTVTSLARAFGSQPADLVVAIGPSIGSCCYEVGDDVRQRFEGEGFSRSQLSNWFAVSARVSPANPAIAKSSRAGQGRWFLDIWRVARDQLIDAGVPSERIHIAGLCTASHPGSFCSYRRDGSRAGRLAGTIRARRPAD